MALPVLAQSAPPAGEFPLGIWYEGGVGTVRQNLIPEDPVAAGKMYDRDFADIAAHGLNVVVVPNTPAEHHQPLLDAAQKHGLKLIIELGLDGGELGQMIRDSNPVDMTRVNAVFDTLLKPIENHPALWKVQLLDEPAPGVPIEHYAQIAEALRKFDPAHAPFCCLAGIGSVETFAKVTHSDVVAWDHYPIRVATPVGDAGPMKSLAGTSEKACRAAAKAGAHTWAVLQCHAITGKHRFPTPQEIRAMTWLSLATGSRGVFWFLYQTEALTGDRKSVMSGLVDENYKSSDRWDEVGRLAHQIRALGPTLADLTLADDQNKVTCSQFARVLVDSQKRVYVLAVNMDTTSGQKTSLRYGTPGEVASDADVVRLPDLHKTPVAHEGAELVWDQTLEPGQGVLYRIE